MQWKYTVTILRPYCMNVKLCSTCNELKYSIALLRAHCMNYDSQAVLYCENC